MIRAVIFDFGRVISAQKPESLFRGYEQELGLTPGTINTIMFESSVWQDALLGKMTTADFGGLLGRSWGCTRSCRLRTSADGTMLTRRSTPGCSV